MFFGERQIKKKEVMDRRGGGKKAAVSLGIAVGLSGSPQRLCTSPQPVPGTARLRRGNPEPNHTRSQACCGPGASPSIRAMLLGHFCTPNPILQLADPQVSPVPLKKDKASRISLEKQPLIRHLLQRRMLIM